MNTRRLQIPLRYLGRGFTWSLSKIAEFVASRYCPDLMDLIVFGGIGAIGYGVGKVNEPAAWIVVGVLLFGSGVGFTILRTGAAKPEQVPPKASE